MRQFFATCPKGSNTCCATNSSRSAPATCTKRLSGVHFSGDLVDAYRACLWSRLASRILMPLSEFAAADEQALYDGVQRSTGRSISADERHVGRRCGQQCEPAAAYALSRAEGQGCGRRPIPRSQWRASGCRSRTAVDPPEPAAAQGSRPALARSVRHAPASARLSRRPGRSAAEGKPGLRDAVARGLAGDLMPPAARWSIRCAVRAPC